jgi:hypothetical protein
LTRNAAVIYKMRFWGNKTRFRKVSLRNSTRHVRRNYFCGCKVSCIVYKNGDINFWVICQHDCFSLFIMKIRHNTQWNSPWKSYEMGLKYDLQVLYLQTCFTSRLTRYLQRLPHSLNWGDKTNLASGLMYTRLYLWPHRSQEVLAFKLKSVPVSIPGPVVWNVWLHQVALGLLRVLRLVFPCQFLFQRPLHTHVYQPTYQVDSIHTSPHTRKKQEVLEEPILYFHFTTN